jgi:hypothetical protein
MKLNLILAAAFALSLASCITQPQPLYTWGNYTNATYDFIKTSTDGDRDKLLKTYESMIKKQKGVRQCVPPGIYADYGYLLIKTGNPEKGKEMLLQEIALYPESKVFVERIVTNLQK